MKGLSTLLEDTFKTHKAPAFYNTESTYTSLLSKWTVGCYVDSVVSRLTCAQTFFLDMEEMQGGREGKIAGYTEHTQYENKLSPYS